MMWTQQVLAMLVLGGVATLAGAQAQPKSASQAIDEYRAMLADGNPADLFEAKGEALWTQKRGPKNASLEACDRAPTPHVRSKSCPS